VSKLFDIYHLSGSQLLYLAFVFSANYQVLKWIFKFLKNVATSDLMSTLIFILTPSSVIQKRIVREKLRKHHEKKKKEREHQEALESHRKYKGQFFNLQFIAEDRRTLFKSFAGIKWQEGNQKVGESKKPWIIENHEIAFLMFQEMAAYRWQLLKKNKWTPEMETFWLKILPKKFVSKEKEMTELEKAILDFEEDISTKSSA
jgi:hypothetical protein